MNQEDIRNTYLDLKHKNEVLLAGLKKQQLLVSLLRLFVFVAGGILSAIAFGYSLAGGILIILITIILFLFLVKKFEDYSGKI
jgi:fatty acid desaturase